MNLYTSPKSIEHADKPIIFLAGPIRGTDDWQTKAAQYITETAPDIYVANPRRPVEDDAEFLEDLYISQVEWETKHLHIAGAYGCVLFWCANETRPLPGRPYAQTTRFEMGEWFSQASRGEAYVSLGFDDQFTGARYIRKRVERVEANIPVSSKLEETCDAAIALARKRFA